MNYVERIYSQSHPEPAQGQMPQCSEFGLFEDFHGLIVLGDPGMGKTRSFEKEAERDPEGEYIKAITFINTPKTKLIKRYKGKTLYIDGLDEVRAQSQDGQTALTTLINKIAELDCPKFRLSCRSLEWDNIDLNAMTGLVDEKDDLAVISLQPLNSNQIESIAEQELDDHNAFLKEADNKSFFHLLSNPHNLELFLSIYKRGETVKNRTDLFEKACEVLVKEKNEAHAGAGAETISLSNLIEASGLLCAVHLLTNSAGLSLTNAAEDTEYPYILDKIGDKVKAVKHAAKTRLFRQDGTNRIAPCHRTIAEYLAAAYLVTLSRDGLPIARVVGMIVGDDDGMLSDLRGLYAWITTLYPEQSDYLISRDPVGVLIYGDISKFSASNKRTLLNAFKSLSRENPWFLGETRFNNEMGNLICSELEEDFESILENGHDDTHLLTFILEAMEIGKPLEKLAGPLLKIANDNTHESHIRHLALTAYNKIKPKDVKSIRTILDKVHAGEIQDDRREMRGEILKILYPEGLSAVECLKYIIPQHPNFMGVYWRFMHDFIQNTEEAQLPDIAVAIINEPDKKRQEFLRKEISPQLFLPLLRAYGDSVDDKTLYEWLSCMKDRYGHPENPRDETLAQIKDYYLDNPHVYKKLYEYWLENIAPNDKNQPHEYLFHRRINFQEDVYPTDFGDWLLEKARSSSNPEIKKFLFAKILSEGCYHQRFNAPSYEDIFLIKDECEEFIETFEALAVCPLADWQLEELQRKIERKDRKKDTYQKDIAFFQNNLDGVRNGEYWQSLNYVVQKYIHKENQGEKFNLEELYAQYPAEYCDAIIEGLENLLKRKEIIPTLRKVATLSLENSVLTFGFPFMYGCRAAWEKNKNWYKSISDEAYTYALVTHWVSFNYAFDDDDWFFDLINHKPDLFIEVVRRTTGFKLSKKYENVDGLNQLTTEKRLKPIADKLVPEFLRKYKEVTYNNLSKMLYFCLLNDKWSEIERLAQTRAKNAKGEIRNLWQAALFLGNPDKYGADYEKFVGKSSARAWSLIEILNSDFLSQRSGIDVKAVLVNEQIVRILGRIFPPERGLRGTGFVGPREDYKSSEMVAHVIDKITNDLNEETGMALTRLSKLKALKEWKPKLLHALKSNSQKRREQNFEYKTPQEVLDVLKGGRPQSQRDLKEFIKDHIEAIAKEYRGASTNLYQKFWQTKDKKSHGENRCRDRMAEDLEIKIKSLSIHVETEGTHKGGKSSDMKIIDGDKALPIEIKKNKNKELWTGIEQLQKQYCIDPKAQGYGIYVALWFGEDEQCSVPKKIGASKPKTPEELKNILESLITKEDRHLIDVIVIDLTKPLTSKEKQAKRKKT